MPINITMPALSPTMEEGNLAKWHVKVGDTIAPGDVIAEIETDKATMEVESVDDGTIASILIDEGAEGVKVNSVIAVLAEEGEDVGDVSAAPVEAASAAPKPEEEAKAPEPVSTPSPSPMPMANATPSGDRIFATPLARRIAEQKGIDLSAVSGSGPNGRIVKADVEGFTGASAKPSTQSSGGIAVASMSDKEVLAVYDAEKYEELPHDGMRRVIAERLTQSAQTIPSYNISMDCELDALLKLRKEINASAPIVDEKPTYKVSVNDFIVKAMALALRDVPMANAAWTSGVRILHKTSDVGVAVAVDDGLFTPIVRDADMKSLVEISAAVKDMAKRARNKKLAPHEYQGGSTAVSNLGMFGVSSFTSIINPPHASIVSIGAGREMAVSKNGEIVSATVMDATFAFDHRVIDGALGAQLAVAFKNYIEKPVTMLI